MDESGSGGKVKEREGGDMKDWRAVLECWDDNVRVKIDAESNSPFYLCFVSRDRCPESGNLELPCRQTLHKADYRGS